MTTMLTMSYYHSCDSFFHSRTFGGGSRSNGNHDGNLLKSKLRGDKFCASRSSLVSTSEKISTTDVTIVGGGIAGLLAAVSLSHAGLKVNVFEKSEDERTAAGTMISLYPNGLKAISTINPKIAELLKSRGAEGLRVKSITLDGVTLKEIELGLESKFGHSRLCLRWSKILETFSEFLPKESLYSHHTFTGKLFQDADSVTAIFESNGKEIAVKSSLLIGADGIHSNVRKAILGDSNVLPRDNGRTVWRLIMPKNELPSESHDPTASTLAVGNGRVLMLCDCGDDNVFVSITCTDEFSKGETLNRSESPADCKARLLRLFSDAPAVIPVIQSLNAEAIIERRVLDLPPLPKWKSGRVLLIGDAAHGVTPSLGQGANMACEDVLELTRQLLSHSSIDDALDAYVNIHGPRVQSIVQGNQAAAAKVYTKNVVATPDNSYIFGFDRVTQPLFPK